MMVLKIMAGALVGGFAALGLFTFLIVLFRALRQTPEQRQAQLNAAQARIVAQQRRLAALKKEQRDHTETV